MLEGDHVDWPAEVAYRYVRALANVEEFGIAEGRLKKAAAGLAKAGPVDEKEELARWTARLGTHV